MKRLWLLICVTALTSCAIPFETSTRASSPPPARNLDLLSRALAAVGGVDALRALRSASVKGSAKYWAPEQSEMPGGEARFAADASFDLTLDFVTQHARMDWVKKFAYPSSRTFVYTELLTPKAGFVLGIDSNARNAQSRKSSPPAHNMSGLRLAAAQRELHRSSPALLLDMHNNSTRVRRMANVAVGAASYPALTYDAGAYAFIVMFDPESGLPARVRTLDYDNIWGDVTYDLVLSQWQALGAARVATSQRYELNGRMVADIRLSQLTANPALNPAGMNIPRSMLAQAAQPATANVPYQWVIRRQFIGTYLDSDDASYDMRGSKGLSLKELAPGVHHVVGGSHNSLIVEMRDHLIVFDAPVSDRQSNWTIRAARARFGAKPIRYLVLTHHHMDHAGGLRAYLGQHAKLVVGRGAAAHYRRFLVAPATRNPDLPPSAFAKAAIIEVQDRFEMTDGRRRVSAHVVENPHAVGMLIGYVEDARYGFVADLWSPGREPLPNRISPPLAALVSSVKRAGIAPLRFAGGHGSTAEYAPLAGLAALQLAH